MTREEFERLFAEVSNWGRWGEDDQRGALNLITPETVRAAVALVREGVTVNLSWPLPTVADVENYRPVVHLMTRAGDLPDEPGNPGDYLAIMPHGYAITHIDALCHYLWNRQSYNGRPASVVTSLGARANAIDAAENGIIARGVLLDVTRTRGVEFLEPGEAVLPEELDAAERAAGLRVGAGDVLLVRTGRAVCKQRRGLWDPREILAGLHASCARWLRQRDVAVLGCDGISDVLPSGIPDVPQPLHVLTLNAMGVHLLDNVQLEAAAESCAARGRWEFLMTFYPLRIARGTASPLNPVAVF
jgi:kynurenine formamidase